MTLRLVVLVQFFVMLVVFPATSLMQFFTSEPMGLPKGIPEGMRDLVNNDARIAGMIGPIADTQCFYAGDTATLNSFLVTYSELPDEDATIRVVLHEVPHRLHMKRFDQSDRYADVDWTLHLSEFLPGRPNEGEFEGKKLLITLGIWVGGQIELDKLEIPLSLEVESGGEIEQFIQRHNEKRKQEAASNGPR